MRYLIDAAAFAVVFILAWTALDDVLVALVAALIAAGAGEALQRRAAASDRSKGEAGPPKQ